MFETPCTALAATAFVPLAGATTKVLEFYSE